MDVCPNALYHHLASDVSAAVSRIPVGVLSGQKFLVTDLPPEATPRDYAAAAILSSILKKYQDSGRVAQRADAAIRKFLEVNETCRKYDFDGSLERASVQAEACHEGVIDELDRALMNYSGLKYEWAEIFANGRFGPGASYKAKGTSEYQKLTGSLSCAHPWIYQQWLSDTAKYELEAKTEILRRLSGQQTVTLDESKLSCVEKNLEIDRTICSEPSLNTYYQLGLAELMTKTLKTHFDVDLEIQQRINRGLARVGSVTGRYATIDLSSASDSISLTLTRKLFPEVFSGLIEDLRCSATRLPDGTLVPLHMISSMGNGTTFPLQTMIFSAVVRSAYRLHGIPFRGATARRPTFGVNGDDIIVDQKAYNTVIEVLEMYGFAVNVAKTFSTGRFRESCGGDYYDGHYVRGVYCKHLRCRQDVASLLNRLNLWSARWNVPLVGTASYLLSYLKGAPLVPRWETDTSGIKIPFALLPETADKRIKVCRDTGSTMYRRWSSRPKLVTIEDVPSRGVSYNEAGIILTSVKGSTRSRTFSVRLDTVRYESRFGIAPCWEQYYDSQWRDLTIPAIGQQRWVTAVSENLCNMVR